MSAAYWTQPRLDIRAWLRRRGARSLAEMYEASVMMVETQCPGHVRFVSHAVRDIRNRLPGVLDGEQTGGTLPYHERLKVIRDGWVGLPDLPGTQGEPSPDATGGVLVPAATVAQIGALLEDDLAASNKVEKGARRLFVTAERVRTGRQLDDSALVAIAPAIRQWLQVTRWFESRAHDRGVEDNGNDLPDFKRKFELFERALLGLFQEFYPAKEELDEILEDANS
jgi:hypothetical protein